MADIEKHLTRLENKGFDFRNMILQGSVVLAMLDIIDPSEVNDIDAIVNKNGRDFLREELRWKQTYIPETESQRLQDRSRNFEVFDKWFDGERTYEFDEMRARAHRFGDFTLGCVRKDVRKYKTLRMDKNDSAHLEGIKAFTSERKGYYLECLVAPHANNIERLGGAVSSAAETTLASVRSLGKVAVLPSRNTHDIVA